MRLEPYRYLDRQTDEMISKIDEIDVVHIGGVAQFAEATSTGIRSEGEVSQSSPRLVGPPG